MACSGLPAMPDAISAETIEAVRAAAAESGIAIAALSGTFNMIHPNPAVREDGVRRLAVLAPAARAMGTRVVTVCTGTRDPDNQWQAHPDNGTLEAWRDLLASIEAALEIAETHDIDLGIEPELANVVSSAALARRLIDTAANQRLKIIFDAANLFEREALGDQRDIVSRALDLLADRIVIAHAKDRDADGGFAVAGQGVLDYGHYVSELRRVGFDGALIAHGLGAADAPAVAAFLRAMCRR
jgi:sugar phosphate isomerase/epimerase